MKDKKKRKTSTCVLCKCAVAQRTVSEYFVGLLLTDVFGPVFNRFSRTKRKRIGTIDPNQKFCQGDGLCRACASMCGDCVRDRDERKFESTSETARKLAVFQDHVVQKCKGKLPRSGDLATLARWNNENDEERDGVPIGSWWWELNRPEFAERLERLKNFDDASKNALAYLATCALREDRSLHTVHDVRKLKVFHAHVVQKCKGKLPRREDLATIARWNNENDEERDGVPIGTWWYDLNLPKFAERLERLKNFDDASKNALAYLATCAFREHGKTRLGAVHDVRKLAIFQDHVVQKCKGKLPRKEDLATIARWNNENDEERDGVPIGKWWYNLNRPEFAERLERLKNFDDASKNALAYLATCALRERKPGRKAK